MQLRNGAALLGLATFGIACSDPAWVGSYATTGHWNLSGPLSDGRSAGDAIADLLIDQVATHAPLPGGTSDDLAVELDGLFRPRLRELIDESAPPELRAGGSITNLLKSSLANVKVESTLTLEEGGDDVEGVETFVAFEITDAQGSQRYLPSDLGTDEILAEWNGEEDDDRFEIETHEVGLQYGALVLLAAKRVVDATMLESVETSVLAAIDCNHLVTELLDGRTEIEIDLGILSTSIDADTLTTGCSALRGLVEDSALGLFAVGSAVEVGGTVIYTEREDGRADLRQGDDYGGLLNVAPAPIAPKVSVAFDAAPNDL